ncbi:MAG TPA: Asp-tRNA(Asn)/Glu-tRNA(Gln) amidotransferase subunit GatC [Candidatus Saccharimonadales bacterium]|nr:Asp-tRNA(Asn)/Glu-tRNA(Gln) amidotransferase subunit GatC [Candidatus Saccharimonadales bacterium]
MAKLSRDDVLKLAQLARLSLSDHEVEEFKTQINEILRYIAQLQKVDTSGLKPTSQVTGLVNVMRDDMVEDYGLSPEDLLRNVPHKQDGQIKVKRMVG